MGPEGAIPFCIAPKNAESLHRTDARFRTRDGVTLDIPGFRRFAELLSMPKHGDTT
ncbi:protein of unknown function [Methylocaldum szegediense]|uniref:Uncharacterized protein n=1 Tax=Methylocaldum szegediense TaxID=73780 RepID=A0ABN8X2I6_9GAMM|nr:protein of unknown function [Methylocaldum szegediense]